MKFGTHRPCNDDIYPSKLNKVREYYQMLRLSCQDCDIPRTFFGVVLSAATA